VRVELKGELFKKLSKLAIESGVEAYVVGGYVRDIFLERASKDVDIVVLGDGIEFAGKFAALYKNMDFAVFKNFGTALVKTQGWEVEFVGARKESYQKDSRKPSVKPGTLEDDQLRRDFTINALAISLNEKNLFELVDPFDGISDIKNKILKTPHSPELTFDDDPLRMMRGVRFASQLGFKIEEATFDAIRKQAARIDIVSYERISEELNKILLSEKPSIGLNLLKECGLLKIIFPELLALSGIEIKNNKGHKDNFAHTLKVLDNICEESKDLWLRWAALLHDIGKAPCKRFIEAEGGWTFHGHEDKGSRMVNKIFRRLKLPLNEKMKFVEKIVAMHHRPKVLAELGVTDSAIRRLIVDSGDDLDALFMLCRADITSRFQEKITKYRSNLEKVKILVAEVEERDALRNWQPPVSGEDIMIFFGIEPGRIVGTIKNDIREAILEGKIKNNRKEAVELMTKLGIDAGLSQKNKINS